MNNIILKFWRTIRRLSGDDAYERYLLQYAEHGLKNRHYLNRNFLNNGKMASGKGLSAVVKKYF